MRNTYIEDELGGFDDWQGNFRVRRRWYKEKQAQRQADEFHEQGRKEKAQQRKRHSKSRRCREEER